MKRPNATYPLFCNRMYPNCTVGINLALNCLKMTLGSIRISQFPDKRGRMSLRRISFLLTALLLGLTLSSAALADRGHFRGHGHFHHGHARLGIFIGGPLFWPYPGPYYYYPPVVAVPSAPPVYIERGDEEDVPAQGQAYWYYCADSATYYPYVKKCPSGWQRVPARPPSGN
jgi:hypothetical protein